MNKAVYKHLRAILLNNKNGENIEIYLIIQM